MTANPRLTLLVIAVMFALLNTDITTVNVALVTVGKDLHADLAGLQWGLNSYMLAFAALIVAAGRLADVFGRRLCLLAGSVLFAVASLLCGMAPSLSIFVVGRILQGAGGALMLPAGMALISVAYQGEERAAAIGMLVGVAGVAQSIGPLVGGFLTAALSWRMIFLMNLPLLAAIMVIALRSIRESRDETASRRIDLAGVLLLATALTAFLLGLDRMHGPSAGLPVALLALALIMFVLFLQLERRRENAILDTKLLRVPAFLCASLGSGCLGFVFFLFLFIAALYLQEELGYSALNAGIALVPFSLVLAFSGVLSGRLTRRFPLPTLLLASSCSMALGLAVLSFVPAASGYFGMVIPLMLIAAGAGPGFTLLNAAGLAAVPPARSGQATGMIYMFRFGGGAIGVAVASALHSVLFRHHLVPRLAQSSLSFAQQRLLEQPGAAERLSQFGLSPAQIEPIRQAFHDSFHAAFAGNLRLSVLMPIAIIGLVILLMKGQRSPNRGRGEVGI